jgi:hypothetical protein
VQAALTDELPNRQLQEQPQQGASMLRCIMKLPKSTTWPSG